MASVSVHYIFNEGQYRRRNNPHARANAKTDWQARKLRRSNAEAAANDTVEDECDRVHALILADKPDPVQYFSEQPLRQASGGSKR